MNCPSRPDNVEKHPDWNQNPQDLNGDATTRADLNGIVNQRAQREHEISISLDLCTDAIVANEGETTTAQGLQGSARGKGAASATDLQATEKVAQVSVGEDARQAQQQSGEGHASWPRRALAKSIDVMLKYAAFVGPGFLIAVAYIDPGNYATDVSAGAQTKYAHLFIVLLSNLIAVFLQSLCIKLGSVTGLNLAENCRKHLPRWLVWALWLVSEAAIVATDVAEVIGTAIALNLLLKIPLIAGCAISIVDVFILLIFYNPDGSMTRLRVFEYFVMALVLGVVVCFCIQLSYIQNTSVGEVFKGYVPSAAVVDGDGIYLSCGIIGATVMPHSIFLGSGVVLPRLRMFDEHSPETINTEGSLEEKYLPSVGAIRSCLKYSIFELAFSLFTFALFVNSAILIVAGAALYDNPEAPNADLFGIHDLLSKMLAPAAGVVFALALLLSGTSAGIVCTMAGQMVSEGMIQWTVKPWIRRLATRTLSIIPSIVVAAAVGRKGLDNALNNSQVALSVALPFVTAPLVYFTCKSSIMTVTSDAEGRRALEGDKVNMRNGWIVATLAVLTWLVLVVMNVALIVLAGLGKG